MSSLAVSLENVSKVYRLGEIDRSQFFGDVRRWISHKLKPDQAFGDPAAEFDEQPSSRGVFYALKNVSFDIKQGEGVGIIGFNGAGKSTLLKLISRITLPSSGRIRVNGRISSLLEVGTGFHPDLTGRDNVYLNGAILGMSRAEIRAKFDEIVDFSGIEKFIDTPVKRYSSGMYVRLAFSVASILEPEIFIVDEVLAVGDIKFRQKCLNRMSFLAERGHTIIAVAHFTELLSRFCTRAIWMRGGEVVEIGPLEEVGERYQQSVLTSAANPGNSDSDAPFDRGFQRFSGPLPQNASGLWRASSFSCEDQDGRAGPLRLGEPCRFVLEYCCPDPGKLNPGSIFAALIFEDSKQARVMALRSDFLGLSIDLLRQRGQFVFKVPKLPLVPGLYPVGIRLFANGGVTDFVKAGPILVEPGGNFYRAKHIPPREFSPVCVDASVELCA